MVLKRIDELKGNEILAKPLMTLDYKVILPEGSVIKTDYIDKMYDLGVLEVYIQEDINTNEIGILKTDIEKSVKEKVKNIIERHTYHHNQELAELSKTADNIISTILEEECIVEKIFDIKERSADIYEHSINTCSTAILTALKLNVDKDKIHDIGVGCLLHDIGLRYTTIDFCKKDVEGLTPKEMQEYKKHSIYGYSSLKDEEWISELTKNIILYHHERMDGSGFPLKLKDIPLECKIVSVCDSFDEMICGITNKRIKVYEAVEYLKNYRDIQFDGRVVDAFLDFVAVYPTGSIAVTNEGETVIVISQNKEFQDRPVVRILKDKYGHDVKEDKTINLVEVCNIFIDKVITD